MSKKLVSLTFSELVELVRKEFAYENYGYADAAKIVDRAIIPQKYEYAKQLIGEHQHINDELYENGRYEAFDELHTKNKVWAETELAS